MPASRQRSLSPFIALAVMAMMGVRREPLRDHVPAHESETVASKPSISGICTSINTTSN